METLTNIQDALLKPINELEAYRSARFQQVKPIQIKKRITSILYPIGYTLAIISIISLFILGAEGQTLFYLTGAALSIVVAIGAHVFYYSYEETIKEETDKYKMIFKEKIILPMTQIMAPQFKYSPELGFSKMEVEQMKLLIETIGTFHSEDLFECNIGGKPAEFGEVYVKHNYSNNNTTELKEVFSGLIFKVSLGATFSPMTIYNHSVMEAVKKDYGLTLVKHKGFPSFRILLQKKSMLPHLPNDFLNFLMLLKKELGAGCVFKVQGTHIYLAINWRFDFFNPKLSKPLLTTTTALKNKKSEILDGNLEFTSMTEQAIDQYYEELKLCIDIVGELEKLIPKLRK